MKARVIETGEIVEVTVYDNAYDNYNDKLIIYYKDKNSRCYAGHQLDFDNTDLPAAPDYWEKLKHQYAGMAMQGILSNQTYTKHLLETSTSAKDARDIIVDASFYLATALVEKLKEGK